ncbi:MAG: HYR domain-containing protein [Saprospirales bacterium]|nr:HYR domain-containing protein [Saprospirales bacterium]
MIRYLLVLLFTVRAAALFTQPATAFSQNAQSAFFLETNLERGYTLCPAGNGNIYVAGMRNLDMVLLEVSSEGEILSADYIDVGFSGADAVAQIIVDSEGKLVIAGNTSEDAPDNGFVFRYDPALRKTLWAKTFGDANTLLYGVLEQAPGGNFLVYANPHPGNGDDAEFMQLDRNTGNIVAGSAWRYDLGSSDQFSVMAIHLGALYAVGRFTNGTGFQHMRQALLKIDLATGAPVWTRLCYIDPSGDARLYGRDMVFDNDAVISAFSGNDAGVSLSTSNIFLQKTTLDGDIQWLKKYDIPGWQSEYAEEIVSVADGYVIYARTLPGEKGVLFFLKTDKNGDLQWIRKIEQPLDSKIISVAQDQLLVQGDYLLATGFAQDPGGEGRMFLLKTTADGQIGDSCAVILPVPGTQLNVLNPVHIDVNPGVLPSPTVVLDLPVAPPVHFIPEKLWTCQQVDDDCLNLPDITFTIDSAHCSGGKIQIFYTQCNQGGAPVGSYLIRFYPGDPTQSAVDDRHILFLINNTPLGPGQCRSGVLNTTGKTMAPDGVTGQLEIFSVANHASGWTTPFSFDSFPSTNLIECNYFNNLSSVVLPITSPVLDLGPDIVLCNGNSTVLDAGPGFIAYAWSTGAATQSITVTDPGTYWVEVTDDCGFVQRDSLFFTFSLLPDTQFPDTTVCPGGSLVYSVPGFDFYSWSPAAGLSCTDCPAVTIQPASTTSYALYASTASGCVLQDTFLVKVVSGGVLNMECPPGIAVMAAPDAISATVAYAAPVLFSGCPCGDPVWSLAQGLPSGSAFPLGLTQVCLQATDGCNAETSCCFAITVNQPPGDGPCDVKETPCVRFEILGIFQNPAKQKIYRMRVVNKCPNELVYVAFQLPGGLPADLPASNTVYIAPSGRQYEVRNPNASPFPSIRFKSLGSGIAGGASDIFEYTLPSQAAPLFIGATARLSPQVFYETHLNVFDCPIQQVSHRPEGQPVEDRFSSADDAGAELRVFPNPAADRLSVDLTAWRDQTVQLMLHDVLGQLIADRQGTLAGLLYDLELPAGWPGGWYVLTVVPADGQRRQARFLKTQ